MLYKDCCVLFFCIIVINDYSYNSINTIFFFFRNGTDIEDILSPNLDDVLKSCTFNKISNQPRVLVTDFSSPSTMYDDNDSSDYAGDSDDDI